MKSRLSVFLVSFIFAMQSAFAVRTNVPDASLKLNKASQKIQKMTKKVKVSELVHTAEPFFSVSGYEALLKKLNTSKKLQEFKIDKIMHGENFFYLRSGDVKVIFRWVDKNNVAFTLNGQDFSYEEASKTELWQPKVFELIKGIAEPKSAVKTSLLLNLFFPKQAQAFMENLTLSNPWVLAGLGIAAVALIGNTFYQKHKKKHAANKNKIKSQIKRAKSELEKRRQEAQNAGITFDASPYQQRIAQYETLLTEYSSNQEDVGFFGYLFGRRIRKPAIYDTLMLDSQGTQ